LTYPFVRRLRQRRWLHLWVLLCAFACAGAASNVPPSTSVLMGLPQGAYLHMLALPLGRLEGTIRGDVVFDQSGTRAVFTAVFPGATLSGDWRSLDPVQAFVLDAARRTLTQLTIDGQARSVRFDGKQTVAVQDGDRRNLFSVPPPSGAALPALRMASAHSGLDARFVAQGGDGRFVVSLTAAGRYVVEQIGARTLRAKGTSPNGAYSIVGGFLVWADRDITRGPDIARDGAIDVAPPTFAGSAYGNALAPIVPLGHAVYQGAYRNGVAYFAFTYGVRRIVAQTSDLLTYSYPQVPADLSYTVGDGFGADANGRMYFGRPESDEVTFWRDGHYVHETLTLPSQAGSEAALEWAMERVAPSDPLWPPMRPDEDALDTALLQWRLYPIGDAIGERWIASYLGHILLGDAHGRFRFAGAPQYPFAILGRTDDGRLWGASPQFRYFSQNVFTDCSSTLWWSRDGVAWLGAGHIPGDAGAVGLNHQRVWVALTHPWLGKASIWVMPLGSTDAAITGGSYAGEQLFFASLPTGFHLVWGATPGRRLSSDEGPLSGYRVDQDALYSDAISGLNAFAHQIYAPDDDPSLPAASFDVRDALPLVQPTLDLLAGLPAAAHVTLATDVDGVRVDPARVTLLSLDQERAYEIKYAGRPYPLAFVRVAPSGDGALVSRSFAKGPLDISGSVEHWTRAAGRWQRTSSSRWVTQR
jgi:hypothetical protein